MKPDHRTKNPAAAAEHAAEQATPVPDFETGPLPMGTAWEVGHWTRLEHGGFVRTAVVVRK